MAVTFRFMRMHLPVLSDVYGPVPQGSLVTILGTPESRLTAVVASLAREAVSNGSMVALLMYRGMPEDYLYLLEISGINIRIQLGKTVVVENVEEPATGLRMAEEYASKGFSAIVLDYRGLSELSPSHLFDYLKKMMGRQAVTYLVLDKNVLTPQTYSWVSKLSEMVLEFRAVETPSGFERMVMLLTSKRFSRDIRINYRITERGIAFESTTRL